MTHADSTVRSDGTVPATTPGEHHEPMPEGREEAPPGVRTMAILRWVLVAAMALGAVAAVAGHFGLFGRITGAAHERYHCPMHPAVIQDQPGECPICGMDLVPVASDPSAAPSAAAVSHEGHRHNPADPYACPMCPEETSDDPDARCPICGMKLEPRPGAPPAGAGDAGSAAAPATPTAPAEGVPGLVEVMISPERIQLMGMRTAAVTREELASSLRTVGYVTASERSIAQITTRTSGWIEKLPVDQTGQKVKRGQVVATIYSPELLAAQQEYVNALAWSGQPGALAGGLAADARRRLELLGVSATELDTIARTREPLRALPVRSPVTGHVTRKGALAGLYVQPGTELFEVADLSRVWVLAEVYEHEIGRIREGQQTDLEVAAFPGERFAGKVTFLYPTMSADTRTLRVRVELANPGLRLRPGMYGNVTFATGKTDGLVVPREAIVDTGELQYAFVARPEGRFQPRRVKLGVRSGDKVQVLSGLAEGEQVVTTANFLIDSESRLRAAVEGSGVPAAAHQH